jgi:hypothetical protein
MTIERRWIAAVLATTALTANQGVAAAVSSQEVQWIGEPAVVAPGVISTDFREVRATVSPNGKWMLWGSSNRPGGAGSYDIWMSQLVAGQWSAPAAVPFNTKDKEFDPAFSPDGRWVYFFSSRPGGLGGDDIYRVPVVGENFGAAQHLGAEINSAGNEWAPTLSPDGRTLIFSSDGRGGQGRHDLFIAQLTNGHWSKAQPIPGAINSPGDEFDAAFLSDSAFLVYSHSPDLENEPVTLNISARGAAGYARGTVLPFSSKFLYAYGPEIDWHDRSVLYFAGVPIGSKASADIYEIRYRITGTQK